ncbi:tRNA (adenosine(37)-N6)-threonylcarbamoyltransferase complex ATPase subunit type 1 TsaE [Microbacterium sp. W1N]|uniref:tRNA (adenosine(37)-N6)-threonylcarbamoyltransferase complex ATPase subunit type 1 TsaE n=1 Tax=Microbacterium festucae TaxID=2977531 RepID=UPI0021C17001|nr:tRNA (adenosine(37)-N6)-threonylcarbamoyltransferase complex ATPase subunit type 1 TsaE [Microbacterium festucae]MCT9818975.1 tRNA (adenosine(37)-N6)-threonylcarbamoyltransferase complex ATPase subunit type 1 TsaE [Microbacterium festucae]
MSGLDAFAGEREVASPADMEALGRRIGAALGAGDLVVLTGPLGAGKTTLTRGIGAGLGIRGPVQSPTFVLARTHPSLVGGPALVHVDAYRLGSPAELDDLDIDLAHAAVIVEWGRGMVDGLVDRWWEIEIERGWSGTGLDTACGTAGPHAAEMEDAAPRTVRITPRP